MYRVELIAAPAGPRAEGVVTERPAPEVPTARPAAPETKKSTATKAAPKKSVRPTKTATPNITKTTKAIESKAPPKAGGGPAGGAGSDVVGVNTAGIAFPFPGYLNNVVRQIALAFEVPPNTGALTADVTFLIHRDGSISDIRLLKTSGGYVFDKTCLAAVEAAGRLKKFGPLPEGFTDDVLPVIFSFDPKRMR